MAATYNYMTAQVTFDFHLIKKDEICELQKVQARVGAYGCSHCPHFGGVMHGACYSYIKCKHSNAKDSKDSQELKNKLESQLEINALSAL